MWNKLPIVSFLACGMLIGIPLGVIITNQCALSSVFLEVKLIQLIQLLMTLLIAIFLTYFINMLVNRDLKKSDIVCNLIDTYQNKLSDIFILGESYFQNADYEKQREIISSLKTASILLSIIIELKMDKHNKKFINYDGLWNDFIKFKIILTNSPFGEKNPKYSLEVIYNFESKYKLISGKLYNCKLKLYSY